MTLWIVLLILVILIAIFYISAYNGMHKAKINTEKETLSAVVALRNQLVQVPADDHEQAMQLSNQITDSLKSIFALAESYPDLKANQNFGQLQEELTNTENKIAYSRQLYNSCAASYNKLLVTFPSNIVANIHHFSKVDYLSIPEEETKAPKVSF